MFAALRCWLTVNNNEQFFRYMVALGISRIKATFYCENNVSDFCPKRRGFFLLKGCEILSTKKFVGVKHKPEHNQVYWFEVPESLCETTKIGSRVLCDTSRGNQEGTVVSVIEGVGENKAQHTIGARFPLKKIVAVKVSLDIDKIHIPYDIQAYVDGDYLFDHDLITLDKMEVIE